MRAAALALLLGLQGCAVAPSCSIYISLPLFIPAIGCGLDAEPADEEDLDV